MAVVTAGQPPPMGLKFYQHVEHNPRIKFSNYLKDRFQVDQKISASEVQISKSQRRATASYGGRRCDPRAPGGCWVAGLSTDIGLRSGGGRKNGRTKACKPAKLLAESAASDRRTGVRRQSGLRRCSLELLPVRVVR